MGDKTQLLAFSLAARFKKPWTVMAGIFVATVFNHALASYAGEKIAQFLNTGVLDYVLGASFIAFGLWTLKPDTLEDKKDTPRFGAFVTTAVLFFLAEMGDKTQLATVALGATYHSAVTVTLGTTLGMMASDGLAVFLGETLGENLPMKWLRLFAAALFFAFGAVIIYHALHL